jgi:two-component system, NarL family, nitrate/nitrite response regulator NarL
MGAAPPILVADGDRATRQAIGALLRRMGYETTEAKTGPEALELATRLKPALVILEVNLEEVSGYEVCRELRDTFGNEISVIFVSAQRTTPADRVAGLLVGADDYIVKPFDSDELLARARAVLRRRPVEPTNGENVRRAGDVHLTEREREVLALLGRGLNQAEIASALVISPKTVAGHIERILTKLGVHSRAQAVAVAHQQGLVNDVEGHGRSTPSNEEVSP